jgi:hypothetical protein
VTCDIPEPLQASLKGMNYNVGVVYLWPSAVMH